jgi:peptidyl-prolyl cis-trans isomerase A (cyclophilin A)
MRNIHLTVALTICSAILAGGAVFAGEETDNPALLEPGLAKTKAPETFKVKMVTTAGDFVIQVHRGWAPHGADRFFNLVSIGYYTDVAFYRVIEGFMAQFGMNGDPAVTAAWSAARIPPDPAVQSNIKGRVTFAMGGSPDTRTSQIFINFGDNSYLDDMGFAPFGEVIEGFEAVQAIHSGYGEGEPRGKGPAQSKLFRRGNEYLKAEFPEMDFIKSATIVE